MAKVHHTQVKQAAKLGGTLVASDNTPGLFIGSIGDKVFQGPTPAEVLNQMLTASGTKTGRITSAKSSIEEVAKAPKPKKEKAPKKAKKAPKKRKSEDEDGEGEDEEGEDEEEGTGKGSVVKAKYKKLYQPTHDTNGDEFTEAFRAATVNEDEAVDVGKLGKVAKDNGLSIAKWSGLRNRDGGVNTGMIRMNLGNVLRGMVRRGITVNIGGVEFKGLPQKEKPAKVKKAPKVKVAKKT